VKSRRGDPHSAQSSNIRDQTSRCSDGGTGWDRIASPIPISAGNQAQNEGALPVSPKRIHPVTDRRDRIGLFYIESFGDIRGEFERMPRLLARGLGKRFVGRCRWGLFAAPGIATGSGMFAHGLAAVWQPRRSEALLVRVLGSGFVTGPIGLFGIARVGFPRRTA